MGIRRFDGQPVQEAVLRAMADRLIHRGPDSSGTWVDGSIGFGHRRLSIIDVDGSHLPMASADDRLHLTFNGEIFNYRELRARSGYPFRTNGDTEVVLAQHARHGPDGVKDLRGQFSYALHDGDDLWLVRDRLGVLPLFYYLDDRMLVFASEVKALLPALPAAPAIDEASLDSYLTRRAVAAPYTLFRGIRKVRPAHVLRVGADGSHEERPYWSLPSEPMADVSPRQAVGLVSDALEEAVASTLVADVPVGALLSGGVDSSLIVALAAGQRRDEPLQTFAAGFGDPRFDELEHARETSRRFGTDHHEITVLPERFVDLWRTLTWHRDAPISEPADVAVYELASEARRSVKVLLSGEGSDELFGGYPKYRLARWSPFVDAVPAPVRKSILEPMAHALPARAGRPRIALRALAAASEEERLASWFAPFLPDERRQLLGGLPSRAPSTGAPVGADPVARMLAFDCQEWLSDNLLERGDRMAMARSVELRPPFLDHRLVELAFSLPSDVKVRRGQTKWVLKQVARRHLPASTVDRAKVGFRVPLDQWFRGHLSDLARDTLLDPNSFVTSVMDRRAVRTLVDSHASGRRDESIRIWTLVSLEVWHDVYIRSPLPPAAVA